MVKDSAASVLTRECVADNMVTSSTSQSPLEDGSMVCTDSGGSWKVKKSLDNTTKERKIKFIVNG